MDVNIATLGGSGRAEKRVPDTYNRAWISNFAFTLRSPNLMKHELGHTLGLNHDDVVEFDSGALPDNYQDNAHSLSAGGNSIMGSESGDFNICQKIALGWVEREQVQTVTSQNKAQDRTYTISAMELNDPKSTLSLRIPFKQYDPAMKKEKWQFYYVQYNKPVYSSTNPNSLDSGGLEFRIWDEGVGSNTQQVYINHADPHNPNAPLQRTNEVTDGAYFYDKIHGIKIRQLRHSDTNVAVQVLFDKK